MADAECASPDIKKSSMIHVRFLEDGGATKTDEPEVKVSEVSSHGHGSASNKEEDKNVVPVEHDD